MTVVVCDFCVNGKKLLQIEHKYTQRFIYSIQAQYIPKDKPAKKTESEMQKTTKLLCCLFFCSVSFRLLLLCVVVVIFLVAFFASILLFIAMELRERDTTAHVKNNLWELGIYCLFFGIIFRWPFGFCHAYVVTNRFFFKLRSFSDWNSPSNNFFCGAPKNLRKRSDFFCTQI